MDHCVVAVNRQGSLSAMVLIPGLVSRQDKLSGPATGMGPEPEIPIRRINGDVYLHRNLN